MNYCTKEQVIAEFPGYDADTANPERIERIVEAASRIIDLNIAGVNGDNFFAPADEVSEKLIPGTGINSLILPRFIPNSIVSMECSGVDFNYDYKVIKNEIYFVNEYGQRIQNIRFPETLDFVVTAKWGYEAIPKQIEQATIALAVELLRDGTSIVSGVVGGVKVSNFLTYKKPLPPEVEKIVKQYESELMVEAFYAGF